MNQQAEFDLVPTHLAIEAMRDNGYRNTAYAVAELIDNAIQAEARHVELLCVEDEVLVNRRHRRRIKNIAVIDDGTGMDEQTLRMALQFGNGTRLDDRTGIGRFGMGLPSSSISQCKHVEVWTWQSDPGDALHTYIDLREVQEEGRRDVPAPTREPIPTLWEEAADHVGESGTLVVWSKLDRCMWKTARTIIERSEFVIGRMYRRFLHEGEATIRMAAFEFDTPGHTSIDKFAKVNDPTYLMAPSSTPEPYHDDPMFEPDGDHYEVTKILEDADGDEHEVILRFTVAKDEVRQQPNAGATAHGKHARKNIGVSLMRAGRELELDQSLVNGYDPRERWWGVEIDFPPSLDELFGVTNNKQSARHFNEITSNIENLLADDTRSVAEIKEELEAEGDPTSPLIDIVHEIDRRLRGIRKAIKIQAKGQRTSRKRYEGSAEEQATQVTKNRQAEGYKGESDEDEKLPPEQRQKAIQDELVETGLTDDQAAEMSHRIVEQGIKYTFAEGELEGRSFFTVKPVAGEIVIKINLNHPAYTNLVEVLEEEVDEDADRDVLVDRLDRANKGLKLLLMAWARYEDEEHVRERRELLQDIRTDWGRVASRFLQGS